MTKTELAGRLGLTKGGYDKMMAKKTMKVETLEKIAEIFGMSVQYFIDGEPGYDSINKYKKGGMFNEESPVYEKSEILKNELELLKDQVEFLNKQMKIKDGQIEFLQSLINKQNEEE